MTRLPKHLRERSRYLAVVLETWPDATVNRRAFQRHCWYAAQNLLGDVGSARVDLLVYRFDLDDGHGTAVVRVPRDAVDEARAALACVTVVDGDPIGVRVVGVSGTVRACEAKFRDRAPSVSERDVQYDGASRPAVVRDDAVDIDVEDAWVGATLADVETSDPSR